MAAPADPLREKLVFPIELQLQQRPLHREKGGLDAVVHVDDEVEVARVPPEELSPPKHLVGRCLRWCSRVFFALCYIVVLWSIIVPSEEGGGVALMKTCPWFHMLCRKVTLPPRDIDANGTCSYPHQPTAKQRQL